MAVLESAVVLVAGAGSNPVISGHVAEAGGNMALTVPLRGTLAIDARNHCSTRERERESRRGAACDLRES